MNNTLLFSSASNPAPTAASLSEKTVEDEVRKQVWGLLSRVYQPAQASERRADQRYPLSQLVYLTPVGPDGFSHAGEPLIVVGKHVSERGLGFFHQQPLPHRRMIDSMELDRGDWVAFLIDLRWCRFTRHNWYESGGRLLQAVPSPVYAA